MRMSPFRGDADLRQPNKVAAALAMIFMTSLRTGAARALLLAAAVVATAGAAAATPADALPTGTATLPPPSGDPLHIDFARDPFLRFMHDAAAPESFRAAVGAAVDAHPAVAAAIQNEAESTAVRTEVRSGLFPGLDAQLVGERSVARSLTGEQVFIEQLSPTQRNDATLAADQLLYDFGATSSRIHAASARIKAAQAEVERVATDTALRAVTAYYDVLTFQTLVELNAAQIDRHRQILTDTRARFVQGLGTGSDVARAEAYLADAEVAGMRYQRRLDAARGSYREVYAADAPVHPARPAPAASQAASEDAAVALSKTAPPVAAAAAQTAAARDDLSASKGDALPRLSASVTGNLYDLSSGTDNYDVRARILLRQTFSTGGASIARVDEARARYNSAEFTTQRIANESARDASVAWTDIALLEANTATLQDAYAANRRARDMFVGQFRVSRGTLLDLLRAEQDYFNAAANYLQGAVELDVARYTLLARTGELLPVFGLAFTSHEIAR
jgi:outer membrane protein, adhesin transport system